MDTFSSRRDFKYFGLVIGAGWEFGEVVDYDQLRDLKIWKLARLCMAQPLVDQVMHTTVAVL